MEGVIILNSLIKETKCKWSDSKHKNIFSKVNY